MATADFPLVLVVRHQFSQFDYTVLSTYIAAIFLAMLHSTLFQVSGFDSFQGYDKKVRQTRSSTLPTNDTGQF